MGLLWLVTLVWAFSFSLIDVYIAGRVDSYLAVLIRMLLALALFLPVLRPRALPPSRRLALMAIGAVQIGVMYLFLYHAFIHLEVAELLLFTIFTPLYVTLIDELLLNRRHLPARWWLAAALAVAGAAVIRYDGVSSDFLTGFLLIQAANLCFAAGQVAYKRLPLGDARAQVQVFGYFFLGASIATGLAAALLADWSRLPAGALQWSILLWLGLGASGLGYLGWNLGAKRVNTGQLATMNNVLIPAGILVNYLFWSQSVAWARLALGGAIILGSVWLCRKSVKGMPRRERGQI